MGAPLDADLAAAPTGAVPCFLVRALHDTNGANLDRIQIVKGWLNADGTTSEAVFDVACGGRDLLETGCDGPIGTTVHTPRATWRNEIGQAALGGYWEAKTFDPTHSAFYSVRVPEIPTPRWTPHDAKVFGAEIPKGAPLSIQERSYTSPICTRHRFCGQGALRGDECRKGSLKPDRRDRYGRPVRKTSPFTKPKQNSPSAGYSGRSQRVRGARLRAAALRRELSAAT